MRLEQPVTIVLNTKVVLDTLKNQGLHIKLALGLDVPPCPYCGEKEEAIVVVIEPSIGDSADEYNALLYPCGYIKRAEECHNNKEKKP